MVEFDKLECLGNSFIFINQDKFPAIPSTEIIRRIMHCHYGVGADQLLFYKYNPHLKIAHLQIFNADGSCAKMCGNGIRAFGKLLKHYHHEFDCLTVMIGNIYTTLSYSKDLGFILDIGTPKETYVDLASKEFHVEIANQHIIKIVSDLETCKQSLNTSLFAPNINYSFVSILSAFHSKILTHEAGVGFTLACGSAISAAFFALYHHKLIDQPHTFFPPSEQPALLQLSESDSVIISSTANFICGGTLLLS